MTVVETGTPKTPLSLETLSILDTNDLAASRVEHSRPGPDYRAGAGSSLISGLSLMVMPDKGETGLRHCKPSFAVPNKFDHFVGPTSFLFWVR